MNILAKKLLSDKNIFYLDDSFFPFTAYIRVLKIKEVVRVSPELERQLVQQLRQRDFDGLELFIEHYAENIRQSILQLLLPQDYDEIPELENKIYFKIWQKIQLFDSEKASLKTWSSIIARRIVLDYQRQMLRQKKVSLDQLAHDLVAEEELPLAKDHFLDLLTSLSVEDQEIFLRYYFYQATPEEIAAALELSVPLIYNRLSRGRKKLRSVLKEEHHHESQK